MKPAGGLPGAWYVFVAARVTVYIIRQGRGDEAAEVLSSDYSGVLVRDGWAPYRRFQKAIQQTCLFHLMRRCHLLLETARAGQARFPTAVLSMLKRALLLRDRRDERAISLHGLRVAVGRLQARADRLLRWQPSYGPNRVFAKHLRHEQNALFTFLKRGDVDATNGQAERALRPAVVTRKVCGGNRTPRGAHTQEVLTSVLRTCWQQGIDFFRTTTTLLCSPTPIVAHVNLTGRAPPHQVAA